MYNFLYQNQFAYTASKSAETVLHNVETCAENAVEHKETALGPSLT
jgi:hypothetical protein